MSGILIIDHRQGQGIDGKRGTLEQYDTANCVHCGNAIALLKRGTETLYLSCIDIAQATMKRAGLSDRYTHKYRCTKCHDNICRACALRMEAAGWECPGPLLKQIEENKRRSARCII